MRVLLTLTFCALAAAIEVPEVLPEWLFAERTLYLYDYRSLTATDLPQKSHQASGIETKAALEVLVKEVDKTSNTATVQLRLVNVTTAWIDKEVMDLTSTVPNVYHTPRPEVEVYFQKWVYLKFAGTKVVGFYGTEGVPESVLNVYRAIASVLTLNNPMKPVPFGSEAVTSPLRPEDEVVVYKVNEESLVGVCETVYHVHSVPKPVPGAVLNFTKVINHNMCLKGGKVPTFKYAAYDSHGCPQACLTHKPLNVSKYYYPSNTEFYDPYDSGCPESFHPETDVAESFLSVSYNVSTTSHKVGTIEGVKAIDKKVFVVGRQQLVTTSVLDMNLKVKAPLHMNIPMEPSLSQQRVLRYYNLTYVYPTEHYVGSPAKLDLEYLSLFGPYNPEEVKRNVRELVTRLADLIVADDLSVKGDSGELVVQLVEAVSTLKEEHLTTLLKTVVNKERIPEVSDKHYVERKALLDVFSLAGTDSAAKFLFRLIAQNKLTLLEALHVLGALQGSLVDPSPEVLDKLQELLSTPPVKRSRVLYSTVAVTFAEVVKKHCVEYDVIVPHHVDAETLPVVPPTVGDKVPKCSKLQYEKYVKYVKTELAQAKDYPAKVVLIQTLARLNHPLALEALVPYVTGVEPSCALTVVGKETPVEACQYLRQVAVYALRHSIKGHALSIQPVVQDLYFNKTEDYELRLAAFNLFLASEPTEGQLMRLLLTLPHEENNQVASYVYSALLTVANSSLPCQQKTAVRVQQLLSALTEPLVYGVQYSKYKLYTQYAIPDNFGVKLQHDYVFSNVSLVPRAFYAGATFSKGPYVASLYDVSVVSKGLQKLNDVVRTHGGPLSLLSETLSRIRRALSTKAGSTVPELDELLKALETSFTFNYESVLEEPKMTLATSFLGADYVLPLDKYYVLEVAKKAAMYVKSIWHQPIHKRYTQVLLPYTYLKVSPAISGLPVVQVSRYPVVLSLSVKDLKLRLPKRGSSPDVFALAALVQPSVFVTGLTSSYTVTPLSKKITGVKVQERTKATYPVDVAIQYSPLNRTVALTVRPRFTKVFEHTTKVFTFTAPAVLVGSRERPVVHQVTAIRPQLLPFEHTLYMVPKSLGLGLHVQGYSDNPKLHIPVYLYPENTKKGCLAGLLEILQNPVLYTRAWYVKVERHPEFPVDEYKVALRWNTTASPLVPLKTLNASEVYNHHYPHDLQIPIYDRLYEEYTGRLPPKYNLAVLFKKLAAALEPHWLPVNPHLTHLVKKAENTTLSYLVEFVAAALGPREVKATVGHLYHGEVFDHTLKLSQLYVNTIDHPLHVLLNTSVARSPLPSPFYSNVSEVAKHKLVATLVGEFETENLPAQQQFTLKAVAEPSDEQLYGLVLPNGTLYKPWFVVKCEEDKKKGLEAVSYACKKVFEYYTNLNKVDFKVIFPSVVPAPWKNITHYLVQYAKVKLYSNLYADYVNKTAEGKLLGKLTFSEKVPEYLLANLTLETPHDETLHFRNLAIPRGVQLSLPYLYPEVLSAFLRKNYSAPLCMTGVKNLTTFDNVTLPLELKTSSKYLLVRENSDEPDFTLVVEKATPTSKVLKIVLKNETLIVLKPSLDKKSYVVLVNSSAISVSAHVPHLIQYQPAYFSQVTLHVTEHLPVSPVLWLYVRNLGLQVLYDGVNVYVKTLLPVYHGRLVGLCGNSNGEYSEDLYGPEGCLYEEPLDFVNSYGFGVSFPSPKGPVTCPPGVTPRHGNIRSMIGRATKMEYSEDLEDSLEEDLSLSGVEDIISVEEKHITLELSNRICVSVEKVPACKAGLEPVESEKLLKGFVCLRKKSPKAKEIVKKIQMEETAVLLGEKAPKPNYEQVVDVAKVCM
uniref:Vitellogenin n=1 Tax=Ornithodoros moubata TaxID=6938 RepID=B6ZIV7_ORNMO|nr:vitellogenin [Ornithodoros moubata]